MDNIDELKNRWKSIEIDNEKLRKENRRLSEELQRHKVTPLQNRLARRTNLFRFIGLLLPVMAPMLYYVLLQPLWVCISYALFGLFSFALTTYLHNFITAENLSFMPVVQASERAVAIRLKMIQVRCLNLLLGIPLIVVLMSYFIGDEDETIFISALIGLVLGIAIGVSKMMTDAALARKIIKSLKDCQIDE